MKKIAEERQKPHFSHALNRSGFSVIESLLSVGLLAITISAGISFAVFTITATRSINEKNSFLDLRRELETNLQLADICLFNLSPGLNLDPKNIVEKTIAYKKISVLTDGKETALATVDDNVKAISLSSFKRIDDNNALATLTITPKENPVLKPIQLSSIRLNFADGTGERPLNACSFGFAGPLAQEVFQGAISGTPEGYYIGGSFYNSRFDTGTSTYTHRPGDKHTEILSIQKEAQALVIRGSCTIKNRSGYSEVALSFHSSSGAKLMSMPICYLGGTDNDDTQNIQVSRFFYIPANASEAHIEMTLVNAGPNRSASGEITWLK